MRSKVMAMMSVPNCGAVGKDVFVDEALGDEFVEE